MIRRKKLKFKKLQNECIICISHKEKDKFGYTRIKISSDSRMFLHRYVYTRLIGNIPENKVVMHSCDNPSCCNIRHLKLGTQSENIKDAFIKDRKKPIKGENNILSKVTNKQVEEIRNLSGKLSQSKIARIYNISQQHVCRIINKQKRI